MCQGDNVKNTSHYVGGIFVQTQYIVYTIREYESLYRPFLSNYSVHVLVVTLIHNPVRFNTTLLLVGVLETPNFVVSK